MSCMTSGRGAAGDQAVVITTSVWAAHSCGPWALLTGQKTAVCFLDPVESLGGLWEDQRHADAR